VLSSEESRPDEDATSRVGVVPDGDPAPLAAAASPAYATWGHRVVAAIFDNAILAGTAWLALGAGFAPPMLTPVFGAYGAGLPRDPLILVPIGAATILLVLQAMTGWTPGKLVVGIRVVRERSSGPAGLWTTLVRWVLHLLDAILLIGYLRPLWHARRQTFADGIAHTVVVQELPDLPRRPRLAVYFAAMAACVLGLGYGCVPANSSSSVPMVGTGSCALDGEGAALTTGDITLGGSVSVEQDRRMWTVRKTRIAHPGATISWASRPSARDVGYRVELDARPRSENGASVVSRSWDIGKGGADDWSEVGNFTHTRTISPDGDVHVAQVELTDSDGATGGLGTDVWIDVRLIADGEVVASCGGSVTYDEMDHDSN
jgi:Mce-associated membrane protein